jgi:membrane fusion protein, multidrug efflux system
LDLFMSSLKKTLLVSTLALMATAFITSCGKPSAGQPPGSAAIELSYIVVAPQSLTLTTELAGRTTAFQIAEVRPQVGGIVKQRQFNEGADVKAGQALYTIDPATYQATHNSALAGLAKADANLASVRLKAERFGELAEMNAVSKQDRDDAVAALKQNEADIASAKASVDATRINLDFTRVKSPISGRIGRSNVTAGALVTANQATAMATVQQLDPIYVDVTQSTAELMRLRRALASGEVKAATPGQADVRLIMEDGSVYSQLGKLQFAEVSVDASTGTVNLRAVFPNPKHEILPGMYVRAVIYEGVKPNALLVPQPAVTRDATGKGAATVIDAAGKLAQREVVTERTVGNQWLVSAGLQAGDKLVVEGAQKIRPGVEFKAVPVTTATVGAPVVGSAASTPPSSVIAPPSPSPAIFSPSKPRQPRLPQAVRQNIAAIPAQN